MSKPIIDLMFDKEVLTKLLAGAEKTANATTITLGPLGPNVAMIDQDGKARVVNDGVTIADRLCFEDPYEDMARELSVQAATETNLSVGDGTTTSLLLNWQLIKESAKYINRGKNPLTLRSEILEATDYIVKDLLDQRVDINSDESIKQVATVSSQDAATGALVASAVKRAGEYGSVVIEESMDEGISVNHENGMVVDQGSASQHFFNGSQNKLELISPIILITDQELNIPRDVLQAMAIAIQAKKPLIIIAENFSTPVLKILIDNNNGNVLRSCAIKSPGFGDRKEEILEDIAATCGAKLISKNAGMQLDKIVADDLGSVDKAVIDENTTKLIGTLCVDDRLNTLKTQLKSMTNKVDKKKTKERMAKLSQGLIVIKIGARTQSELNEKKLRIEDAVNATKVAIDFGIVSGGGIALLNSRDNLSDLKTDGAKVLYDVLSKPFEFILVNAGMDPRKVLRKIGDNKAYGMNVATGEYGVMYELGIIDPFKVVLDSLENSISSAMSIIVTSCIIVEKK